jgi:hypothetical protein
MERLESILLVTLASLLIDGFVMPIYAILLWKV